MSSRCQKGRTQSTGLMPALPLLEGADAPNPSDNSYCRAERFERKDDKDGDSFFKYLQKDSETGKC